MSWDENRRRVQFYNEQLGKLEQSKRAKVQKFIEHGCIQFVSVGRFLCNPILGYNKTPHQLDFIPHLGEYSCTCQGWKAHGKCSHVDTLYVFMALHGIPKPEPSLFPV